MVERRKEDRRDFSFYMLLKDDSTGQPLGHLSDLSTGGFKVDSQKQLPLGVIYHLSMELSSEVADKSMLVFSAKTRWCHPDALIPNVYNVGFEISAITPADMEILQRMVEKYGSHSARRW
jgi:hypothetical protein